MAFFSNDEDEQNGAQGMNQPKPDDATAPQQLSGGVASSSTSPISTASQSVAPKSTSSGMTGFQNYQKANQGTATNKLGQAAAGTVSNQAQQAKTSINNAQTSFTQKMDAGSLSNRDNAVNDVKDIVAKARSVTAPAGPTQATPSATPAWANQADVNGNTEVKLGQKGPTQIITKDGTQLDTLPAQVDPDHNRVLNTINAPTATGTPLLQNLLGANNVSRFQDVINAKYQGPESMRQSGDYNRALGTVNKAHETVNNAQSAQGRESLLRNLFAQSGNYSQGLNKLDTGILNSSQANVQNVKNAAAQAGNMRNQLDQAQIGSDTAAKNRSAEIAGIRGQARDEFTNQKLAEEKATEDRLTAMTTAPVIGEDGKPVLKADGSVLTQWEQLPEHFRNALSNKENMGQTILNNKITAIQSSPEYQAAAAKTAQAAAALKNIPKYKYIAGINGRKISLPNPAYQQADKAYQAAKSQQDAGINQLKSGFNKDAVYLNPEEAAILGVQSGEGLYGSDVIATQNADKNKLISKNEQARQAALAQLGGLDKDGILSTNLNYKDAELAGTQNAADALDLAGTREKINAVEKAFRESAEDKDIIGKGHKKVSRGNAWGKTTRHYNAQVEGNAADMLKNAGYNFDEGSLGKDTSVYGTALLDNALKNAGKKDNSGTVDRQAAEAQLSGMGQGAAAGAAMGAPVGGIGALVGGAIGAAVGRDVTTGNRDVLGQDIELINGVSPQLGGYAQDARNLVGEAYGQMASLGGILGGSIGKDVKGMVGGVDTREMKKYGSAIAKENAVKDFKQKYQAYLDGQNFSNRVAVSDDKLLDSRSEALQQLLAKMDKTNT